MTYINPLAGTLVPSGTVQQQQAADKARQIRRTQVVARDAAATSDTFEHQVENAEEVSPVHDEQRRQQDPRQQPRSDQHDTGEDSDGAPQLDLRA